jgi:hypothetical protein
MPVPFSTTPTAHRRGAQTCLYAPPHVLDTDFGLRQRTVHPLTDGPLYRMLKIIEEAGSEMRPLPGSEPASDNASTVLGWSIGGDTAPVRYCPS